MLPLAALPPLVIAWLIPETASRELEEIAPAGAPPLSRAPLTETGESS
jgi:hypothetical protein